MDIVLTMALRNSLSMQRKHVIINSKLEKAHSIKERTHAERDVELTLTATITFIPSKKLVMTRNGVSCTKIVVKEEFQAVMEELLERQNARTPTMEQKILKEKVVGCTAYFPQGAVNMILITLRLMKCAASASSMVRVKTYVEGKNVLILHDDKRENRQKHLGIWTRK